MAALIVLLVLVALGVLSASGHTVDSRDPEYGLGHVFEGGSR